jgi:TonB-dependent Receptor Plug Domain/Carboxypeptidase regulatory-like domain
VRRGAPSVAGWRRGARFLPPDGRWRRSPDAAAGRYHRRATTAPSHRRGFVGHGPQFWSRVLVGTGIGLALAAALHAQEGLVARGTVLDAATSKPLSGAVVAVLTTSPPRLTRTTAAGSFALPLPGESARLVAASIGYAPETLWVTVDRDPAITFRLSQVPLALDPVTVAAERTWSTSAASSRLIRDLDIRLRPRESSQELLRLAPGLVIAQHAGGGKAEQMFLRGFDADHGTDVAVSVDGVPVNMVSQAHGQGYADLHWLIPEVVEDIDVRKSPYDAQDGDFATAGTVTVRTKDRLPTAVVSTRGGSFSTAHTLALLPLGGDATDRGGYLALAGDYTNGPFDHPQHYRRYNAFGKWTMLVGSSTEFVATASGYDARWNASGQIPERAVTAGLISRFGSIDPSEGGNTQRYAATAGLRSAGTGPQRWEAQAYAIRYGLQLYSDFTFFLHDSVNGDGIEQNDWRTVAGLAATHTAASRLFGLPGLMAAGAGVRADFVDLGLFHQRHRVRLDTRVSDAISQQNAYAWAREDVQLSRKVRLELGLRGDLFRFGVDDHLVGQPAAIPHGSGVRWYGLVSPKANVAVQLADGTTLFGNVGWGFHSNDARDVVAVPRGTTVIPRALAAEVGLRHYWTAGTLAAALWATDLQSEFVYNSDEGTTEPSGSTRRYGLDLEGRIRATPWLWADADLNLAHGRFRDQPQTLNRIPLAPEVTSTGGLTLRDGGPLSGGLRYRHVGARAADRADSLVARGYTIVELFGTWQLARAQLVVAVDNLLQARWNEAQFATTSRLPNEPAGVTDLNFTPGAPRLIQVGLAYRL